MEARGDGTNVHRAFARRAGLPQRGQGLDARTVDQPAQVHHRDDEGHRARAGDLARHVRREQTRQPRWDRSSQGIRRTPALSAGL